MVRPVRFRFDEFVLSPRRRVLLRGGVAVPLIPKYFDLLVLLVERRQDAVSKDAIFSAVWSDVIVSDGALAQAVRTLRRTLGDSPRDPRFIRTVSRHGYQFVCAHVVEEPDEEAMAAPAVVSPRLPEDGFDTLLDRLLTSASAAEGADDARDSAERLHGLGTDRAVAALRRRPRHAAALAVMRDTRWAVPGASQVPLDLMSALALARLRLDEAGRLVARRWAGAAGAGGVAGATAGAAGGVVLLAAPGSVASPSAILALCALGAIAGAVGAAGIGAGLAGAEALVRSRRGIGLVACGAAAGLLTAACANVVLRALVRSLVGVGAPVGNSLIEGLALGAAAGFGYAVATRQPPGGGLAAPVGSRRLAAAVTTAAFTAAAAVAVALSGGLLVGGLVNEIAQAFPEAQLAMAPLGRLIGEPDFGPLTRALLSAFEGGAFGFALAWGLTVRPA